MANDACTHAYLKPGSSLALIRAGVCFEQIGNVMGVLIFLLYYLGLVQFSEDSSCSTGERLPNQHERAAYRWAALTLAVVIVVSIAITTLTIQEQEGARLRPLWCMQI